MYLQSIFGIDTTKRYYPEYTQNINFASINKVILSLIKKAHFWSKKTAYKVIFPFQM